MKPFKIAPASECSYAQPREWLIYSLKLSDLNWIASWDSSLDTKYKKKVQRMDGKKR